MSRAELDSSSEIVVAWPDRSPLVLVILGLVLLLLFDDHEDEEDG